MGLLGGKINDHPWLIETNSIDASDLSPPDKLCSDVCVRQCTARDASSDMQCVQQMRSAETPRYVNKKYQLYKTEMCRSHTEIGHCRYGDKCQFAHSESELRYVQRHPKYKTETCKTFWEEGSCPYGKRCCFIHVPRTRSDEISMQVIKTEIDRSTHDKDIYGASDEAAPEALVENTFRSMGMGPITFFNAASPCSFEPFSEDEPLARKPFWETGEAGIWTDDAPLFYLKAGRRPRGGRLAPGGLVCKTFDKKISEFVLRNLNM